MFYFKPKSISDLDPAPERYVVAVVVGIVAVAADDLHLAAGHPLRQAAVEGADEGGQVGAVVQVARRQQVPQPQRRGARHAVCYGDVLHARSKSL